MHNFAVTIMACAEDKCIIYRRGVGIVTCPLYHFEIMKNFYLIIFVCLSLVSCRDKNLLPYSIADYRTIDRIVHVPTNYDGTRNFYLVDSIAFDSTKFEVVVRKDQSLYFFLSKDYLKKHQKIEDKEVFDAHYGVFEIDFAKFGRDKYLGCYNKDEKYPASDATSLYPLEGHSGWYRMHFNLPPAFFRVYLARALEFYVLYEMPGFDTNYYHRPYMFPDRSGYYRVYVPVWK